MGNEKDILLAAVEARARRRSAQLSGEFVRADAADKEPILAALEFERWLVESCRDCQ